MVLGPRASSSATIPKWCRALPRKKSRCIIGGLVMSESTAFDPLEVAKFEHSAWSRCAKGYVDGFGGLVSEAIAPVLDAAHVTRGARVLDVGTVPGLVAAA